MLIDHIARHILVGQDWATEPWFSVMDGRLEMSWFLLLRSIGRMAFPIFAFLIVEGYRHTHDRRGYGQNLMLFALISEIPWNLVHHNSVFWWTQNVFFTLTLGYLAICVYERYKGEVRTLGGYMLGIAALSLLCRADYGLTGVSFILLLHLSRTNIVLSALLGTAMIGNWFAGLAFIPIGLYNGERGFVRGRFLKYCFYAFYPLHHLVLWWIKLGIYGAP